MCFLLSSYISSFIRGSSFSLQVSGYLNLLANTIDNFTHGLAVAASFLVSRKVRFLSPAVYWNGETLSQVWHNMQNSQKMQGVPSYLLKFSEKMQAAVKPNSILILWCRIWDMLVICTGIRGWISSSTLIYSKGSPEITWWGWSPQKLEHRQGRDVYYIFALVFNTDDGVPIALSWSTMTVGMINSQSTLYSCGICCSSWIPVSVWDLMGFIQEYWDCFLITFSLLQVGFLTTVAILLHEIPHEVRGLCILPSWGGLQSAASAKRGSGSALWGDWQHWKPGTVLKHWPCCEWPLWLRI